ncbi:MAG: sigma-70 family RNA polymerase sigma factor [Myxococcales bacterium]|nr:sigma-70 family RNA polymerase sigma factor [Myxococcales bacterium]
MAIRPVAGQPEEEAVQTHLRRHDRDRALVAASGLWGDELGQFCMALLDSQPEAERVVSETLLAFHHMASRLCGLPLRMWLFGRALERCRERRPQTGRHRLAHAEQPGRLSPPSTTASLAKRVGPAPKPATLRTWLERLPSDQREIALLRYLARLDYPAIASLCEASPETVQRKLGRALLDLRQEALEAGGNALP